MTDNNFSAVEYAEILRRVIAWCDNMPRIKIGRIATEIFGDDGQIMVRDHLPEGEALKVEMFEALPGLLETLVEMWLDKETSRRDRRLVLNQRKATNRATYVPSAVLVVCGKRRGQSFRGIEYRFLPMLQSAGILEKMAEFHGENLDIPMSIQLLNQLPKDSETGMQYSIPLQEQVDAYQNLPELSLGAVANSPSSKKVEPVRERWTSSQARVMWRKDSSAFEYLLKSFPTAIDFAAYNHRLRAPLLPGGFLPMLTLL